MGCRGNDEFDVEKLYYIDAGVWLQEGFVTHYPVHTWIFTISNINTLHKCVKVVFPQAFIGYLISFGISHLKFDK